MVDIEFIETGDGGDFKYDENGYLNPVYGLKNQVYLALFGGQEDWWGNDLMKPENQFLSTFEKTINEVVLNSSGISKLVNSAKEDLKYLEAYAEIEVEGSIPDYNRFKLVVYLTEPGKQTEKLTFIWDGTNKDLTFVDDDNTDI